MQRGTRAFLAAIALSFCLPDHSLAGAWTQAENQGLLVLNATYYGTSEYFDDLGQLQPQRHFGKQELNAYAEWGFTDTLTVGANLFANRVRQADKSNLSLSDTEFFLRQRLYRDDERVISLQPLIKLPSLSRDDRTPRSGSKSTDIELALLYGENLSLLSDRDFSDTTLAIRHRTNGNAPQWRYETRLGLYPFEQWLVMPAFTITQSISPEPAPFVESGDLDYSLMKAELTVAYLLGDGRDIHLSIFDHVAGALTGSGRGITLGYSMGF